MQKLVPFYSVLFFVFIFFYQCLVYGSCDSHAALLAKTDPEIELYALRFAPQAEQWVTAYLIAPDNTLLVSGHDMHLINDLLYYSYARSQSTITMQKNALSLMSAIQHVWSNMIRTRRNPSRTIDYPTIEHPSISSDLFLAHAEQHQQIGSQYAHITQQIVHEQALETTQAKRAVETIRSQARLVVSSALLDISTYTQQLYTFINSSPVKKGDPHKKNRLHSFFMNTVPSYAQYSFITLDKLTEKTTQKMSDTLATITQVSSHIWHTLEVARAAFYLAHYRALNQRINISKEDPYAYP